MKDKQEPLIKTQVDPDLQGYILLLWEKNFYFLTVRIYSIINTVMCYLHLKQKGKKQAEIPKTELEKIEHQS